MKVYPTQTTPTYTTVRIGVLLCQKKIVASLSKQKTLIEFHWLTRLNEIGDTLAI